MNSRSCYAFYGSLRRGMSNYEQFESGLEFLYMESIPGYRLFAMENYPYAVRTGHPADLLMVEVFRVTRREVEQAIHELELQVGYYYEEVIIHGEPVGIYLFKNMGSEPLVKSGDWVKFFGS